MHEVLHQVDHKLKIKDFPFFTDNQLFKNIQCFNISYVSFKIVIRLHSKEKMYF